MSGDVTTTSDYDLSDWADRTEDDENTDLSQAVNYMSNSKRNKIARARLRADLAREHKEHNQRKSDGFWRKLKRRLRD